MIFCFQKTLYSKTAFLKAAYRFTDDYYVHLETDEHNYIVTLTAKKSLQSQLSEKEFLNEILAQTIREKVTSETAALRTILMARALSSSMIGELPDDSESTWELSDDSGTIMKDWFSNE